MIDLAATSAAAAADPSKRRNASVTADGLVLPGSNSKAFNFIGFLIMRALPILIIGTGIFMMMLPFILARAVPIYEVQGRIQIERDTRTPMGEMPSQSIAFYFQDYVRTQSRLLSEGGFIASVLESITRDKWPAGLQKAASPALAAAILKRNLHVDYDTGTEFLIVTIESMDREGIDVVLNTMMDRFAEKKKSDKQDARRRNLGFLIKKQSDCATRIATLQHELDNVVLESNSSSFDDRVNPIRLKFIDASSQLDRLHVETIVALNRFTEASNRIDVLRGYSLQPMADELTAADPSLWGVRSWTYQTLQTMRASVDGIAKENPDRKYVDANMEALIQYEKDFRKEVETRHKQNVDARREYDFAVEMTRLESELITATQNEAAATASFDDLQKQVERSSALYWRGLNLKQEIEELKKEKEIFDRQVLVLEAEEASDVRVNVVSRAAEPGAGSGSTSSKSILMALFVAYGLVGAIYFVFDFFDNRIRSTFDVQTALGVPVASSIRLTPPPWRYDGIVTSDPTHPAAANLRTLSYKIERECRKNGVKVMLFTGLDVRNGETSTLRNLASLLARMSMRVAVVDFNCMTPALSAPYASSTHKGVRECLMGECTPEECRIANYDGNQTDLYPFIGPPGTIVSTREAAQRFFSELRSRYDIVLLDTPPVLLSEQTVYLAQHVDASLIILRMDHSQYRDLRKAMTLLGDSGVRAISAVLNFDEARNPVASFMGTIQRAIDTLSETWRLIWHHRAAFKASYRDAGCERAFKKPLRRIQWMEFKQAWRSMFDSKWKK